jgi:D-psicose/D-tagatose/L-ribulose 3-epimerase
VKLCMHNWMRAEPIEVTIKRLARCGYDAVQIGGDPARYDVAQVRSLLDENGIVCWGSVTLMTCGRDLLHEDIYVRYGTIKYMKDCIDMVAELGGQILGIVPSTVGKITPMSTPKEEWRWAVEGLREVAYYAGEKGVRPGIEPINRFETNFINRHDQALLLAHDVGLEMGVVLDSFHLNIEEASPIEAIRRTGSYLIDFHVADSNRYPPGRGAIDWNALIGALQQSGYDRYLSNEFVIPIDRTPAALSQQDVEDAGTAGTTQGMQQFLRDHGSGALSEGYYDLLVQQSGNFLRRFM